jgi:hypothetical protein
VSDSNFNKSIEIFKKLKDSSDEYDKYSLTASFNTLLTALSKKEDAVSKKRYTEVSELYKTFKDKDEEEEEEK